MTKGEKLILLKFLFSNFLIIFVSFQMDYGTMNKWHRQFISHYQI